MTCVDFFFVFLFFLFFCFLFFVFFCVMRDGILVTKADDFGLDVWILLGGMMFGHSLVGRICLFESDTCSLKRTS